MKYLSLIAFFCSSVSCIFVGSLGVTSTVAGSSPCSASPGGFSPVVAGKFSPVVAGRFSPVVAGKFSPVVAGKFSESEPVSGSGRDSCPLLSSLATSESFSDFLFCISSSAFLRASLKSMFERSSSSGLTTFGIPPRIGPFFSG